METLWRIFNRLLIVIVGATFGLGTGVLGVYFAMVALFGELDRDSWGAAPVWILAMIIGGVVATIFAAIAPSVGHSKLNFGPSTFSSGWD